MSTFWHIFHIFDFKGPITMILHSLWNKIPIELKNIYTLIIKIYFVLIYPYKNILYVNKTILIYKYTKYLVSLKCFQSYHHRENLSGCRHNILSQYNIYIHKFILCIYFYLKIDYTILKLKFKRQCVAPFNPFIFDIFFILIKFLTHFD